MSSRSRRSRRRKRERKRAAWRNRPLLPSLQRISTGALFEEIEARMHVLSRVLQSLQSQSK
jgi:hypothetical protein